LKRRGAIDIGSGSTKAFAAVVDICSNPKRIVEKLFDEKVKISFSEAVEQSSDATIPQDVITDASAKIATLAESMNAKNIESLQTVATAAIRKSKNRDDVALKISLAIQERLKGKSKLAPETLTVRVLSQIEEAMLGARSAIANLPSESSTAEGSTPANLPVIVWDIGGGSMQIVGVDSNEVFTGDLASVTFKNLVIRDVQKKDPLVKKSPNPLVSNVKGKAKSKEAAKVVALAKSHAEKNVGEYFKTTKARWVGIGGVLALSVQKQVDREVQTPHSPGRQPGQITLSALEKTFQARATRTDEEIESEYRETEVTNLGLVLGYMQALKVDKVETVEASLVQGLLAN
jgi:exopolyphosphatase/guanosine-5'-triphosphate,3'-diphosphate pyrophosphatase